MPILLLFVFVGFPLLELFTIVRFSQMFGFLEVVFYLFAVTLLGVWVTKFRGRWLLKSMQEQMARGKVPAAEVIQSVFVFFAGVLFIFPGFVSDAIAVVLIFPLTQWAIAWGTKLILARLIAKGTMKFYSSSRPPQQTSDIIVDVTSEDITSERASLRGDRDESKS